MFKNVPHVKKKKKKKEKEKEKKKKCGKNASKTFAER